MFGIGAGEFIIIIVAGLILFGPSKLPEVGRAIGKGLREFRKAQAALSATLNEVSLESEEKDQKNSTEKNSAEKVSIEKNSDQKVSTEKVPAVENISADEKPPHSALTVDDVINLAKENPLQNKNIEESKVNEKISDNLDGNSNSAATSSSDVNSRGNSNSTEK